MFLQKLVEYANSLDMPPRGYRRKPVRYIIELRDDGSLASTVPSDTSDPASRKTKRGVERRVPELRRSGIATSPILLADNPTYTLGIPKSEESKDIKRAPACRDSYRDLMRQCAEETENPAVLAVAHFLENDPLSSLSLDDGLDLTSTITFRVGDVFPIDEPAVRDFWAQRQDVQGNVMQCIVCGQERPALERLQGAIKGIPGGQSSGTSIISANESAFESYGLEHSLIAPICAACAERFTFALNRLLADEHHRLIIGNTVFVYWTRERIEFDFLHALSDPQPEDVRALLQSPWGKPATQVEANRFYAAILGASGGRTQIREWIDISLEEAQRNILRWFERQRIVGPWGEEPQPLGIRSLAAATVRDLSEVTPHTMRTLLAVAIMGRPLPPTLPQLATQRARVEQTVHHNHAALVKLGYLSRHPDKEGTMIELDVSNTEPAYLCGRLLAELEQAQRTASPGVKATIVDRYYGTACTAPGTVFGTLVQNAQSHLSKLERDNRPAYVGIQRTIEDILSGLNAFPKTLTLDEQSLFALGYYHQRAHNRAQALAHKKED